MSYYIYGNKGMMWDKKYHIAQSGAGNHGTLCDTPMLATNHVVFSTTEEELKSFTPCSECMDHLPKGEYTLNALVKPSINLTKS